MLCEPGEKKDCIVFFDFDNTITWDDVLDGIIERFSINQDWVFFEKAWAAGEIGSRECLEAQFRSVRVTRRALSQYLLTVKLDPSFKKLAGLLKDRGISWVIVSDSFSWIIKKILKNNGLHRVAVYSNEIRFRGDRLIPSFPYSSEDCARCAHCKKRHILEHKDKKTIYIGDGLSDVCPAQQADLVFAKGSLLHHLRKNNRPCVAFKDLGEVCGFFEDLEWPARKPKKTLAAA